MLNDKAEIIWSNEDITTNSVFGMNNDNSKKLPEELSSGLDADQVRSTINSEGERSRGQIRGHVFIDRDTDISYYDNGSDNLVEAASSSSFLTVNSANRSLIFIFAQYLSLCWLILKIC
ncbi:unnamed protein product [Brugia timori]|nr:unnamed protein product [Brugia timori]